MVCADTTLRTPRCGIVSAGDADSACPERFPKITLSTATLSLIGKADMLHFYSLSLSEDEC
jgi:hypothetical protein